MHNLLEFLSRHYHWLLFIVLEAVSAVLLFHYNSYQGSVWVSSANAFAGKVYESRAAVESFFSLSKANTELTRRNFYLERQVAALRQRYAELTGDTTIQQRQELQFLKQFQLIQAKVVANTVDQPNNLITIDKGRKDGVLPDMGVACGNGLVGVVYLAGDHYSVVMPVLNQHSRISCSVRGHGYFGYLSWEVGDPTVAYLEDVPRHAKFKRGEWVETSGYSSIFPQGILVGKIIQVYNSRDGLSFRLKVRLSTDFSCLRDVCVISDHSMAERRQLMVAARDSLSQKNN